MSKPELTVEQQVAERLGWIIGSAGHWYRVPEPGYLQLLPDDTRDALLTAEKRLLAVTQERDEAKNDAESWKRHWEMYRDAWVRELGGWVIPKHHEIDSLVLTTRKRCVNPLLGNCSTPHWLGAPTADRKGLQQSPHPQDASCRGWKVDDSEPALAPEKAQ